MTPTGTLERECRVFTRYLAGVAPPPEATRKYVEAHRVTRAFTHGPSFERFLVAVARLTPPLTMLADGHARLVAPRSLLRKKLVLVLAILESSRNYRALEPGRPRPAGQLIGVLLLHVVLAMAAAAVGIIVFLPLQLLWPAGET